MLACGKKSTTWWCHIVGQLNQLEIKKKKKNKSEVKCGQNPHRNFDLVWGQVYFKQILFKKSLILKAITSSQNIITYIWQCTFQV